MNQVENSQARNWDVTYTLSINQTKYGWKNAVLDMGTVQRKNRYMIDQDVDGTVIPILNEDGTPVTTPVMLDGRGSKLDTSQAGWKSVFEWENGSPFAFREEMDLSKLALPNP